MAGAFFCLLRSGKYTNIPPAVISSVFSLGKKSPSDYVSVPLQPCHGLMLPCEGSALALLPVPSGDDLPACGLYDPAFFPVLDDLIHIDRLALLVD